jgi:glycosyltransferase involved in cell wall biosynthesis
MAQRTKVMHIVTRMNVGGVAVLLDNLMSGFEKTKIDAVLVTGKCENLEQEFLENRPIDYRVIHLDSFHKSVAFIEDLKSFYQLVKMIRKIKPDVIHTHTSKAGLFGRIAGKIFYPKAKLVHTFHGHLLTGYFNPVKLNLVKIIERSLGLISNILIAMGTQVRDDLVNARLASKAKFRIFLPGLQSSSFHDKTQSRRELGLASNKIYCIFVGRITKIKRPDRLIEVAEFVFEQNKEVVFLVVGDGDLSIETRELAIEKNLPIQFLGWREDIGKLLSACDISILVSDNEAVPLTLIEASQAGLPIVTTPAGSVKDIAINNENALVADFSSRELAKNVLILASDGELRERLGVSGKKISEKLFSVEHMVQDHQNLYEELLRV